MSTDAYIICPRHRKIISSEQWRNTDDYAQRVLAQRKSLAKLHRFLQANPALHLQIDAEELAKAYEMKPILQFFAEHARCKLEIIDGYDLPEWAYGEMQ
jgi:hypothetical protein